MSTICHVHSVSTGHGSFECLDTVERRLLAHIRLAGNENFAICSSENVVVLAVRAAVDSEPCVICHAAYGAPDPRSGGVLRVKRRKESV